MAIGGYGREDVGPALHSHQHYPLADTRYRVEGAQDVSVGEEDWGVRVEHLLGQKAKP